MKINLEGMKFNRLTVIGPAGTDGRQHRLWECKCECGGTTFATTSGTSKVNFYAWLGEWKVRRTKTHLSFFAKKFLSNGF